MFMLVYRDGYQPDWPEDWNCFSSEAECRDYYLDVRCNITGKPLPISPILDDPDHYIDYYVKELKCLK